MSSSSGRRQTPVSQTTPASTTNNKLRLDSLNKILKIGSSSRSKKHKTRDTIVKQVSRIALAELLKNQHNQSTPAQSQQYYKQDLPDFKLFLSNKDNVQVFREFLKTQYCQENIDFYLACEKFKQLNPDRVGKDLIKFMATQIFNDHLAPSARQPVNIDHNCLQNVIRQMRDPRPDMLCDAQAEIFDLMRDDCYPRFCKTWRLDRETARKILQERPQVVVNSTPLSRVNNSTMISYTNTNTNTTTTTNPNLTISSQCTSCSLSQQLAQPPPPPPPLPPSKGLKRKSISPQPNGECPPKCPYYRIGLPCQQHNIDEQNHDEQTGSSDLIDRIDLRRIHHVPNICKRRSPPPPPLPPKPEKFEISPVINKKFCPYVGKVFDV